MAKKKLSNFKTKSKKNKKSKKPKSKKNKGEKEKDVKKMSMGLKDICSALTGLQVDSSSLKSNLLTVKSPERDKKSKSQFDKEEKSITRLFQKLSCDINGQKNETKASTSSKFELISP